MGTFIRGWFRFPRQRFYRPTAPRAVLTMTGHLGELDKQPKIKYTMQYVVVVGLQSQDSRSVPRS